MNKQELKESIKNAHTLTDVLRYFNLKGNGRNRNYLKELFEKHKIDISHFKFIPSNKKNRIKKICPVCDKEFEILEGSKRQKQVCSKSCSNTYFRSGKNNGNWNENLINYRKICFDHHKKECIICKEKKIIAVHHYDENKNNNLPENLIPLCPTHHQYVHSKYKKFVQTKIDNYRNNFISVCGVRGNPLGLGPRHS